MTRIVIALAALATAFGQFALAATAGAQPAGAGDRARLLARGESVYVEQCVACHGQKGDGQGPGAYILSQAPRNFTLGTFKFRSTRSGAAPTDDDLFRTITQGVAGETGAMMPSFAALPEGDRRALVAVVKKFAGIDKPGAPIRVPPEPARRNLELGARVYERLQCAACHGADGRGDGPSSLTLRDDQKRRIWTPDLTKGIHKRGDRAADIYLSFATGIDGTPMPSYADKASVEELWALTHYVQSLAKNPATEPSGTK
jgi:cytochrome c oxidase cbb3-type subunit 2